MFERLVEARRSRFLREHRLKCEPRSFELLRLRVKLHEWRRDDDRGFLPGDFLLLEEWDGSRAGACDHVLGAYTGRHLHAIVLAVTRDDFGCPPGFAVLSVEVFDVPANVIDVDLELRSLAGAGLFKYGDDEARELVPALLGLGIKSWGQPEPLSSIVE